MPATRAQKETTFFVFVKAKTINCSTSLSDASFTFSAPSGSSPSRAEHAQRSGRGMLLSRALRVRGRRDSGRPGREGFGRGRYWSFSIPSMRFRFFFFPSTSTSFLSLFLLLFLSTANPMDQKQQQKTDPHPRRRLRARRRPLGPGHRPRLGPGRGQVEG